MQGQAMRLHQTGNLICDAIFKKLDKATTLDFFISQFQIKYQDSLKTYHSSIYDVHNKILMKYLFRKRNLLCIKVSIKSLIDAQFQIPISVYQSVTYFSLTYPPNQLCLLTTCLNNYFSFIECVMFFQVLIIFYKGEFRESYILKNI